MILQAAEVRSWTSADGRTLEAEFVTATKSHVTLRRESDPSLVAAVRKTLDHSDASVRIEAAHVLVDVGKATARTAILSRVERERDPQTRSALRAVVRRLDN